MANLLLDMLKTISYILLFVAFFTLIPCSGAAIGAWFDLGITREDAQAAGVFLMVILCILTFAIEVTRAAVLDTTRNFSFLRGSLNLMMRTYVEAIVTLSALCAVYTYIYNG